MLVSPEILPASFVFGEIYSPTGNSSFKDGAYQILGAEHIFGFLGQRLLIIAEVEYQRPHKSISFIGNLLGAFNDIWLQGFAEIDEFHEYLLGLLRISPRLGLTHITVYAHEREEAAHLNPAEHPFLVFFVLVLVVRPEESAGVKGPPGESGAHLAQASGNFLAQCDIIVAYVSGPGNNAVALDA